MVILEETSSFFDLLLGIICKDLVKGYHVWVRLVGNGMSGLALSEEMRSDPKGTPRSLIARLSIGDS